MAQRLSQGIPHHAKYILPILKAQLHLRRMDIHIQKFRLDLKMQHGKRILVLHHKRPVSLLDGLRNDIALDISSINIIIFKVTVTPCNDGLSDKALHTEGFPGDRHRDQICSDFPPVNRVNDIF